MIVPFLGFKGIPHIGFVLFLIKDRIFSRLRKAKEGDQCKCGYENVFFQSLFFCAFINRLTPLISFMTSTLENSWLLRAYSFTSSAVKGFNSK